MLVTVNGEDREFADGIALAAALEQIGISDCRGVAVELDGAFIERDVYDTTILSPGSRLEIVRFVGGG